MDSKGKFSSIFNETEINLARIKERLCTPYELKSSASGFRETKSNDGICSASFASSLPLTANGNTTLRSWSGKPLLITGPYHSVLETPEVADTGVLPPVEKSTGLVTLLNDKLESQSKIIASLTEAVEALQEDKRNQDEKLKRIKDDIAQLSCRMSERGVHLQTEHKVEQWKQEVLSQLQLLQSDYRLQDSRNSSTQHADNNVAALNKDVHDLRKFVREEVNDVIQNMQRIQGRLVGVEVKLNETSLGCKEQHRHDILDRNLRSLVNGNGSNRFLNLQSHDQSQADVTHLSESLRLISTRLSNMEACLVLNAAHNTATPPYTHNTATPYTHNSATPYTTLPTHTRNTDQTNSGQEIQRRHKYLSKKSSHTKPAGPPDRDMCLSDLDSADDGRKSGLGDYAEFDWRDIISSDEDADVLLDGTKLQSHNIEDILTQDLDDVKTADSFDLNLTADDLQSALELESSDNELSVEHLH